MSISDGYELVPEPPTLDDYLALRQKSGLTPKNADQGRGALVGSWAFCHIRSQASSETAAMGRVIGDGGWYFHVADMATLPEHQGRGLGRAVLEFLLDDIRRRAPAGAWVNLIADVPGRALYRKLGFEETAPGGLGMSRML